MWRYFDFSISEFGVILMLCGAVCIILGLTRRAHAPRVSLLSGLLLLLGGGLMWLLPRLNLSAAALTRLSFLLVGIAFVSVDLVNADRRRQCTLPWQGEFWDVTTYGTRKSGLSYGSAVFRYRVDGVSYQQPSLDKRFWPGFLDSPFLKRYTRGESCTIYLNPKNPRRFALSRRLRLGCFSVCGAVLLAAFFLG